MGTHEASLTTDLPFGATILMPTYNRLDIPVRRRQLSRAIDSVLSQPMRIPFELLLVDDGGPCPVERLLPERLLPLPELRIVRLRQNRGLVFALNTGVNLARFSLIARLDDDDYWLPDKFERQLSCLLGDKAVTMAATGMERRTEEGDVIDVHVRPDGWKNILDFSVKVGCPFPHGSVVGYTSVFRALNGYSHAPQTRHAEDYELWSRWIRFFEPATVEAPLYCYTVSEHSVSATNAEQQLAASRLINARLLRLGDVTQFPELMLRFAESLGVPLAEAGFRLHSLWAHGGQVEMPAEAVDIVLKLLPDRLIQVGTVGHTTVEVQARRRLKIAAL